LKRNTLINKTGHKFVNKRNDGIQDFLNEKILLNDDSLRVSINGLTELKRENSVIVKDSDFDDNQKREQP
jgi:hypothetical protein